MQDLYVFLEVLEYSVSKDGIILWLTVAIVSGILSIRGTSIIKIVKWLLYSYISAYGIHFLMMAIAINKPIYILCGVLIMLVIPLWEALWVNIIILCKKMYLMCCSRKNRGLQNKTDI